MFEIIKSLDSKFNLPKVRFMIWINKIWESLFKSPILLFDHWFFEMNHNSWLMTHHFLNPPYSCEIDCWCMEHGAIVAEWCMVQSLLEQNDTGKKECWRLIDWRLRCSNKAMANDYLWLLFWWQNLLLWDPVSCIPIGFLSVTVTKTTIPSSYGWLRFLLSDSAR